MANRRCWETAKFAFAASLLLAFPWQGFCDDQPAQATVTMEGVLLGSGYPRPDPDRAGPSTAIIVKGRYFIVDAGRAVVLRLAALERPMPRITAVLLTHLHSDHVDGLPDLFSTSWIMGRKDPLQIYGPRGTQEMVNGLLKFCAEDIHIRRDLVEHLAAKGAEISVHVVNEGFIYKDEDVTIAAFAVDHRPVEPAFGYKFQARGRTIVISGDTAPSDNLIKFAKSADVLVHEVYRPGYFEDSRSTEKARGDTADVSRRLSRYHTDAEQVGQVAAAAGVKKLVLTHIIPPEEGEKIRELAAEHFPGEIVLGADLTRF